MGVFISCDINSIIESYTKQWKLNLSTQINSSSIGTYSGISSFDDGSILVMNERLLPDQSSQITAIKISSDGILQDLDSITTKEQNIDVKQSSQAGTINFHGISPASSNNHSILSVYENLFFELSLRDLTLALTELVPSSGYLGPIYFYQSGTNLNKPGFSIVKIDLNDDLLWSYLFEEQIIDFFEGGHEEVFVLTKNDDQFQLRALNSSGNRIWASSLTDGIGLKFELNETHSIYGSPSNTITVVGSNQDEKIVITIIDPRGDLIFQHIFPGFSLGQFRDFMVTEDGGFMMALIGADAVSGPSFFIIKLNHLASITWRGEYRLSERPENVEFIELKNRDVVVLTDDGQLFLVAPS